jgi:hypothetical protein
MSAVGHVQGKSAALGFLVLLGEHFREVQIPSLVVRGIGVGDVVGQDFGTLGAEAQGLFVDTERFIEADAHVGKPSGDLIFRRINLASPMPIQKSPETGALPAVATRQCQKSGNGFPPPAAFLPLGTT